MGKYNSNGTNNSSYDRGIYLMLWNCLKHIIRDIKQKRTRIANPRFSMCVLDHPTRCVRAHISDRYNGDDGMTQRNITISPAPPFVKAEVRRAAAKNKPKYRLVLLLFVIEIFHKTERNYTFDEVAEKLIDHQYNFYQDLVKDIGGHDPFLGYKKLIKIFKILIN